MVLRALPSLSPETSDETGQVQSNSKVHNKSIRDLSGMWAGGLTTHTQHMNIEVEIPHSSAGSLEKHSAELVHLDVIAAVEVVTPEQGAHEIVVRVEVQHTAQICELSAVQLATVISIQSIEKVVEGKKRVVPQLTSTAGNVPTWPSAASFAPLPSRCLSMVFDVRSDLASRPLRLCSKSFQVDRRCVQPPSKYML